ncbi:MAG: hypothetical protein KC561_13345, partial [Myxococcales bacterium]|nr:hypothetical protein [Myxococcales bacterium]
MAPLLTLSEIALLAMLLCGLHALKPKVGLIPLYLVLGLFEGFLFIAGELPNPIGVALFGVPPALISFTVFLPLFLSVMVLIYVLEGTREARRLIFGIAVLYVVHGAINYQLLYHAGHPPPGFQDASGIDLVVFSTRARVVSLFAICVDFVVVIVVYQFLYNRIPHRYLAVPFFVALVAAMLADGLVFSLGMARFDDPQIIEKVQSGAAAALPISLYLAFRVKRRLGDGLGAPHVALDRGALEILGLQQRVREME